MVGFGREFGLRFPEAQLGVSFQLMLNILIRLSRPNKQMTKSIREMIESLPFTVVKREEVLQWLDSSSHLTFAETWNACVRSDFIFWLSHNTLPHKTNILALCDVLDNVLHLMPVNDNKIKLAIATARHKAEETEEDKNSRSASFYTNRARLEQVFVDVSGVIWTSKAQSDVALAIRFLNDYLFLSHLNLDYKWRVGFNSVNMAQSADPSLDVCSILRARVTAAEIEAGLIAWYEKNGNKVKKEVHYFYYPDKKANELAALRAEIAALRVERDALRSKLDKC